MILCRSYFLILTNRFSDTFFLIFCGYFLILEITNDFSMRKKIDFDEFCSCIKNKFFLIQKKWKIWGGFVVDNIYWYQELFFISKIIFWNQDFELMISFFYFFVIYLHVTPYLIGRLLRTDDMFSPSSPPVSWRQSVLPYLLEQTFKRWGEK